MPLGRKLSLDPSDIVLDGTQLSRPQKEGAAPNFRACLLWLNGWMDEDATWYEVDMGPGHIVLDGVPALRERGTAAPLFC